MFELENVLPWGRSLSEYRRMFNLTDAELKTRILAAADGPASFNAELTEMGGQVVSVDPLYGFSSREIRQRIDETYGRIIEQTRRNMHEFVWTNEIPDVDALGRKRIRAMNRFLGDFQRNLQCKRYVNAMLPELPFDDKVFDIAVCSHFLFLYSQQLSESFHVEAIREQCRVACEVRIFPLTELGAKPSRHRHSVTARLRQAGLQLSFETVDYEFQRGGNEMMRISAV